MSNAKTDEFILIVAEKKGGPWIRKDAGKVRRFLNDVYKDVRKDYRDAREVLSPGRRISEKVFSGFRERMETLREVDDEIQNWTQDLDNCLDRADEAKKGGRLLDVIFWISQINNRLGLVARKDKVLKGMEEEDLLEFYSDTEHGVQEDYFTGGEGKLVYAGILDGLGRKITNWKMQQMYRKKMEARNKAVEKLLRHAKLLVEKVDNRLAIMSKARASGDIARYMAAISDISRAQQTFEKIFRDQFDTHFSDLVTTLRAREREIVKEQVDEKPAETVDDPEMAVTVDDPALLQGETSAMPATERSDGPIEDAFISPFGPNTQRSEQMAEKSVYYQNAAQPQAPAAEAPAAPNMGDLSGMVPVDSAGRPGSVFEPEPPSMGAPAGGDVILPQTPAPVARNKKTKTKTKTKNNDSEPLQPLQTLLSGIVPQEPDPYLKPGVIPPQAQVLPKKPPQKRTEKDAGLESFLLKKSHLNFYSELQKVAKYENPYLLAMMLSKYSEQIEESDPDTSEELLILAEVICNV